MYKCKACNIYTESFFCPHCGLVFKYPQFIEGDKNKKDRLQSYIKDIIIKASKKKIDVSAFSNTEALTNVFLAKFIKHISSIKDGINNNKEVQSEIEFLREFIDKCKTNDFYVSVAGKIGAGKSTLINALLGKNVIPTGHYSETTVLTKYRYSENSNYIKLSYYKTHEWDALWQSAINANQNSIRNDQEDYLSKFNKFQTDSIRVQLLDRDDDVFYFSDENKLKELVSKYLSCESPYHLFVKEAEIGQSISSIPKNVIVVDSLGIDDPISYRVDFSNKYLIRSNIILLCIKTDKAQLSTYELKEYTKLFSLIKNNEQIYIVGTQYDIPKDYTKYWNENTSPEFIKCFSTNSFYNSKNKVIDRLLHVSAWYYNIIQEATNGSNFWGNEYKVDYLAEVLCRTLGVTVAYQYGSDAISLKKSMEEHLDELKSMTCVPNIYNYIMFDCIKDSEINTLRELKNIYLSLYNKGCITYHREQSLYNSKLSHLMKELDSKIIQIHNEKDDKSKAVKALLRTIQTLI